MGFEVSILSQIDNLTDAEKEQLDQHGNPFLSTGFLAALERSGSVGPGTGWVPRHLLVRKAGQVVALAPTYAKDHSYGEFVFDWSWAEAFARAGLAYYPKLVTCVPFTPATGPRIAMVPGRQEDMPLVLDHLQAAARDLCERAGYSSHHILFETRLGGWGSGYEERIGHQYHWQNRGYADFDDWLAALRAAKRKQIRKERRRLAEAGVQVDAVEGTSLQERDWAFLYKLYLQNAEQHGSPAYLTEAFWMVELPALAAQVLVFAAQRAATPDAPWLGASLCFTGSGADQRVYGRYWGAREAVPNMHFACAYYEPVDWCIAHGKQWYEAGAQGEHKFLRGFVAHQTHSYHWFRDARGQAAVADYLEREREDMSEMIARYNAVSPDKKARREAGQK